MIKESRSAYDGAEHILDRDETKTCKLQRNQNEIAHDRQIHTSPHVYHEPTASLKPTAA